MAQADSHDITKLSDALTRGDVDGALQAIGLAGAPGAVELSRASGRLASGPYAGQGFAPAVEPNEPTAASRPQGEGLTRRTIMNMIVGSAAIASAAAVRPAKAALAATESDPIFALIDAHKHAQAKLKAAEAVHGAAERELQARGAKCDSPETERAMDEAYDFAVETLDEAVETVPTTMAGVLALLQLQRDLWEMNHGLVDENHLSFICESVETALQNLQAA